MTEQASRNLSSAFCAMGEATQTLTGSERDRLIAIMHQVDAMDSSEPRDMEAWLAECYPQLSEPAMGRAEAPAVAVTVS